MTLISRLLALLVLTLLPPAAILVYNEFDLRQHQLAELHRDALMQARLTASEQEEILEGTKNLLIALDAVMRLDLS
jgi:hypothetical protein